MACAASTFQPPVIPGAKLLAIDAALVTNFSQEVTPRLYPNHDSISVKNATFCNVTVSYTHPGDDDNVAAEAWLPLEGWNGRLQAAGGSGLGLGRFEISYGGMAGAIGEGYATISSDGGIKNPLDPYSWVLESPGKANDVLIRHWGGDTLNDMASPSPATIAKSVIKDFYGKPPEYSYFNGCSQGGRQGFELAQKHPAAYDGIAASAPAIHWAQWAPAMYWPQVLMNTRGEYPLGCELDALTGLAVRACDGLTDGVTDGILSDPGACAFDPFPFVGAAIACPLGSTTISEAAAAIANATWAGPTAVDDDDDDGGSGSFLWYGVHRGTDLSGGLTGTGTAAVKCDGGDGGTCEGNPVPLAYQWIQLFVEKDPAYDYRAMTRADFDNAMRRSGEQWDAVVASSDPDLRGFYEAGGKMLTYHGLYDQVIPIQATEKYYTDVQALIPEVRDFYRFYEVPGLPHCFGNGQPTTVFDALRAWVENGTVPESLPSTLVDGAGKTNNRILCPYPERAVFSEECGDAAAAACFKCTGTQGNARSISH
ncbi:Tannase/feruloyl esterase [Xylariomycetidae sp. FL0641]|nr:Tannase/feruloyl esterase [Xylariomycetidae sp. FL0641]